MSKFEVPKHGYGSDPEWIKLGNKVLKTIPNSPKQKELQARMREIEARYNNISGFAPKG